MPHPPLSALHPVAIPGEATRQWDNTTSSIDQLGYFLDEYVLQPIGIKQRLMQLQRLFRELLIQLCISGDITAKADHCGSVGGGNHGSPAVLASHTHRRAILRSPKNNWLSK